MGNAYDNASLIITPNAYKASKLYALKPTDGSGDLTFTRATTATRVNSAGTIETVVANMPRITWELGVDQCPNLLVEKASLNNFRPSNEFSGYVTVNSSLSDLNLVTESVASGQHGLSTPFQGTFSTGVIYCFSFYIKPETLTNARTYLVNISNGVTGELTSGAFNIVTQTFITAIGVGPNWSNTSRGAYFDVTRQMWRIWVSGQTAVGSNFKLTASACNSAGTSSYVGDGTSSFRVAQYQSDIGTLPLSDVITTTTALTKNADVISKTGIGTLLAGAKGLFGDAYLQAGSLSDGAARNIFVLQNSTLSYMLLYRVNNTFKFVLYDGVNSVDTTFTITTPFKNKRIKVFVHLESGNYKVYFNGTLVVTNTNVAGIAGNTTVAVGSFAGVGQYWDGLIKAVAVTDEFTEADIEQISSYPSFANMAEQMMYDFVG
jgi:hypothetical protein